MIEIVADLVHLKEVITLLKEQTILYCGVSLAWLSACFPGPVRPVK